VLAFPEGCQDVLAAYYVATASSSTLMMETELVSEMLVFDLELTWLKARERFISFIPSSAMHLNENLMWDFGFKH
jgi:hypothetical protein